MFKRFLTISVCAASVVCGLANANSDDTSVEISEKARATVPSLKKGGYTIYPDEGLIIGSEGNTYNYSDPQKEQRKLEQKRNEANLTPLEIFATGVYFHGVQYDEAMKFTGQDYSRLLTMLRDPEWKYSWSTIATVIGMVGDETVVDQLIKFIEEEPVTPDRFSRNAKLNAVSALGYPAAHFKSKEAITYLAAGFKGQQWDRRLGKELEKSANPSSYRKELARLSMLGMMKVGTEDSLRIMKSHKENIMANRRSAAKGDVDEGDTERLEMYIKEAEKIKSMGLSQHHKNKRRGPK